MMTSVEIARRATRHLSVKDPSAMGPSEAIELLDAINAALNRYFRYADDQYKRTTATETLLAPVTRSVTIAEDATQTTGAPFLQSERGKAIVIDGDSQFNEIVATNQVLRPYRGTTGTHTGTIYSDAVAIRNFAVERLATHPQILESNQRLVPISEYSGEAFVDPWYRDTESRRLGEPTIYRVSYVGGSRDSASNDAVMVIHIDPIPESKMTIEFDIIIRAANLTLDALVTPVSLPIHESVSPDTFQRLIEGELVTSSLWAAPPEVTRLIMAREQKAEQEIKLLPNNFAIPRRRVGTTRGY